MAECLLEFVAPVDIEEGADNRRVPMVLHPPRAQFHPTGAAVLADDPDGIPRRHPVPAQASRRAGLHGRSVLRVDQRPPVHADEGILVAPEDLTERRVDGHQLVQPGDEDTGGGVMGEGAEKFALVVKLPGAALYLVG